MRNFIPINTNLLKGINLIDASAGTGKTYTIAMLVLRFVVEHDIKSILELVGPISDSVIGPTMLCTIQSLPLQLTLFVINAASIHSNPIQCCNL